MPTDSFVYALMRTDYLDRKDDEGRQVFLSVHGSLSGANAAGKEHVKKHSKSYGLEDPNTNESSYDDGTLKIAVIVGDDDYHSFEIATYKEELHNGTVVPDEEVAEPADVKAIVKEAKEKGKAKGKTNGAASAAPASKAKTSKAKAKAEEPEDDADEDEENAMDAAATAAEPPPGSTNCLSGLKFLITGTLEGFTREEALALIEEHGGEVEKTLKKTLDYVVLGVKAGPKKLDQIKEWELETLNQKGLYDLIAEKSQGKEGNKARGAEAKKAGAANTAANKKRAAVEKEEKVDDGGAREKRAAKRGKKE